MPVDDLKAARRDLKQWLVAEAAPLWSSAGVDPRTGAFHEELSQAGLPTGAARRARVQPRQIYALAIARSLGAEVADDLLVRAWHRFEADHRRPDGFYRTLVDADGHPLNEAALLYDHAFVLLALGTLRPILAEAEARAVELRAGIEAAFRNPQGGFVPELGSPPKILSNPHMHLFEACLAWAEQRRDPRWREIADEIARLALRRFRLQPTGAIGEEFDPELRPVVPAGGAAIEPGHQFEWGWLLLRWAELAGEPAARQAWLELIDIGERRGVDRHRNAAVNGLSDELTMIDATARLWPQTERLKAACLAFARTGNAGYLDIAAGAAASLQSYLRTERPGLWLDRLLPDGSFVQEPSPASSFYHIASAIAALDELPV